MAISRTSVIVRQNNDKTGYTLTAGSYSVVKVVATQISIAINNGVTSGTGLIPTVDTTRAIIIDHGTITGQVYRLDFSDATHVRATRAGTSGDMQVNASVIEFY